jgi:hypothetical protein
LEVELVAGEEEQHAEPEVAEEFGEVVYVRKAEPLGANHDAQEQLQDHDRQNQARGEERYEDGRQSSGEDDRQERACVDRRHGREVGSAVRAPTRPI